MIVVFESRHPCPVCGYRNVALHSAKVRVNKGSVRVTGGGVTLGLWVCRECGSRPVGQLDRTRVALSAADQARVDEYRARRWAA